MNNFLLNTDIIKNSNDVFWNDIAGITNGMECLPVLVISKPLIDEAQQLQLQKMMQACKLSDKDYNLLTLTENQNIAWHKLRDKLSPQYIILLGITPEQLGISIFFMPHQVNRFDDRSWLPTLSIPELELQPDVKKHLWNYGLKPVFIEKAYN